MNQQTKTKESPWTLEQMPRLDGKTFVVTGANSGIGFEAARMFALAGAHVVLACRTAQKAETAIARICTEKPNAAVEWMELDLASLASIRAFARSASRLKRIDVLCNNAGVMAIPYKNYMQTSDGFEMHFGINHLGHFALTGLLFDKIAASTPARIVTVSSDGHKMGNLRLDFDDLQMIRDHHNAYSVSKLANILFTYEMDRRLRARGLDVKAVVCHPGVAQSNLISTGPEMANSKPAWWLKLAYLPAQPAAMGALPTIYAAVGSDTESGDYIGPSGPMGSRGLPAKAQSSLLSHDLKIAQRLWSASEELTGVSFLD